MLTINKSSKPVRMSVVLVAAVPKNGEFSVLLVDGFFPAVPLDDGMTAVETAGRMLDALTGVAARTGPGTSGFEDLVMAGIHDNPENIVDDERTVYATYGIALPEAVPLKTGEWVLFSQLTKTNRDAAAWAAEALRRL